MSLSALPNELLFMVAEYLSDSDVAHLIGVQRQFRSVYEGYLYRRHVRRYGNKSLFWTCGEGYNRYPDSREAAISATKKLLMAGACPSTPVDAEPPWTGYGCDIVYSPLLSAVQSKSLELVKILVEAGAKIEDKVGKTALQLRHPVYRAIDLCEVPILEYFLSPEGRRSYNRDAMETPLLDAAVHQHQFGHYPWIDSPPDASGVVALLLSSGETLDAPGSGRYTPLHIACLGGDWGVRPGTHSIIRSLLEAGADPTACASDGETPMTIALDTGCVPIIELLLAHCPKLVHTPNTFGRTPIFYIYRACPRDPRSSAVPAYRPQLPVPHFRHSNDRDPAIAQQILHLFLSYGACVSTTDSAGNTPLHSNIPSHNLPLIFLLLKEVPTLVRSKNRKGVTPLHVAAQEGLPDIIRLLLDQGADVNARNYYRSTPLHRACMAPAKRFHNCRERWQKAVEVLVERGAEVDAKDRMGQTPLMKASYYQNHEAKEVLRGAGGSMSVTDEKGRTAGMLRRVIYGVAREG